MRIKPLIFFAATFVLLSSLATALFAETSQSERASVGQNNFLRTTASIGPFSRQFCSDGQPGCDDTQGIGFVAIEALYGYDEDVTLLFVCPDTHQGRCLVLPRRFGAVGVGQAEYPIPSNSELLEKLKSGPTGGDFGSPSQGEQKLIIGRLFKSFNFKKDGLKFDGCEPVGAHQMACTISYASGGAWYSVQWCNKNFCGLK